MPPVDGPIHSLSDHADHESIARNRISNISFAVCSAGEIVILAIMVGILKAIKSDESVENNTKAFSVLIAFSGGVWCKSCMCPQLEYDSHQDVFRSVVRSAMVLPRKETAWTRFPTRDISTYSRFQANLCGFQRVYEA